MKFTASFESNSLHLELFRVRVGFCVFARSEVEIRLKTHPAEPSVAEFIKNSSFHWEEYIIAVPRNWLLLHNVHVSDGALDGYLWSGFGLHFIWRFFPSLRGRPHGLRQGLLSSTGVLGPVEDYRIIFCSFPFFVKGLCLYRISCGQIEVVVSWYPFFSCMNDATYPP